MINTVVISGDAGSGFFLGRWNGIKAAMSNRREVPTADCDRLHAYRLGSVDLSLVTI